MLNLSFLILVYAILVALSIYLLGSLRLFLDAINFKSVLSLFLNFQFWLGLVFALFARVVFVVINSQLSKLAVSQNATTTITFIVTLSSVIAVVVFNYFLLQEKLTINQLIGSIVIVGGVLLMFR
jgi:drug/metabolite transporter (DMT)-like permease